MDPHAISHPSASRNVRFAHNYASIVLETPLEAAALSVDRYVRSPMAQAGPVLWGQVMPNERPAGTGWWPRLTVDGQVRLGRRDQAVAIEVCPWDDRHAEVGFRPVGARPLAAWEVELWRELSARTLRDLRAVVLHPSWSGSGVRDAAGQPA